MPTSRPPAVILLSGGLDSATTLAIARHEGFACHALSFDYGQRHRIELEAAKRVAQSLGAIDHRIITIDLRAIGGSALTADIDVPKDRLPLPEGEGWGDGHSGSHVLPTTLTPGPSPSGRGGEDIPITYVPARNTIFLAFALAHAEVIGSADIFIGVNAIDYSGYPDCRPAFIEAFERLANLATRAGVEGARFRIHTPLIDMTKAQLIRRGLDLGVDYSLTFSCYDPVHATAGAGRARACGHCDSCLLRAAGFAEIGVSDPAG